MSRFTIEDAKIEISESETLQQLSADGKPSSIYLTKEEVEILQLMGPDIDRSTLEAMFESSPSRLQMLHNIPH
jgi:hypothetical protein